MKRSVVIATLAAVRLFAAEEPPREWIEPATGHRVIRVSREPGSASFYFHQNAYTTEGDKLVISTPSGISTANPQDVGIGCDRAMYLFRPEHGKFETRKVAGETVKIGKLKSEKLVDLSRHDYELEPNTTFTPDGRWIAFRSNMHGASHVYAVEAK